jgi:hypothetical protein
MKKGRSNINGKFLVKTNTDTINENFKVFYEIEKILDRRTIDAENFYFVKWKYYSEEYNTWEPITSFSQCPLLIKNFDQNFEKYKNRIKRSSTRNRNRRKRRNIIRIKIVDSDDEGQIQIMQNLFHTKSENSKNIKFLENQQYLENSKNEKITHLSKELTNINEKNSNHEKIKEIELFSESETCTINVINLIDDYDDLNKNTENSVIHIDQYRYDTQESDEILDINKIPSISNCSVYRHESPKRIISHELNEKNEVMYKLEMKSRNLITKSSSELRYLDSEFLIDYLEQKLIKN